LPAAPRWPTMINQLGRKGVAVKYDLLLTGGEVLDPAGGLRGLMDIGVAEDHHATVHHARSLHARVHQRRTAKPEDRHAAIARLCEQVGGKLVSLYFTLGEYDFIVISEMPDAKAVSMLAFVAAGGGGIEGSVTSQAFTTAKARDMFAAAGKIVGSYKPMGAS
jgi:uncharacterized protein with GYD domain